MATAIQRKIKKLESLKISLKSETIKIASRYENEIIRLNASQFENGIGSDGKRLINSNPIFKGRYTLYTQMIASVKNTVAPKTAGNLYNFAWNGDFLSGMYVYFDRDGKYKIFSTGMGTGEKLDFFKGYNNLFGLTDNNKTKIVEKIRADLKKYIRTKI